MQGLRRSRPERGDKQEKPQQLLLEAIKSQVGHSFALEGGWQDMLFNSYLKIHFSFKLI